MRGEILADDGKTEVEDGQAGEIWIRGPNVMKGYWERKPETEKILTRDKWLKSGDIGYVNPQGLFYVLDRKKELIKVKANQVAPAELEALLLEHPLVADAAVVRVIM